MNPLDMDSSVPLMHHDSDRSWIIAPDPDHPKGTHPWKPLVFWENGRRGEAVATGGLTVET